MTSNPWSKFYWHDWDSDPGLRACSLAAQGLWMRMLCIASKATPTGYLTINGNAVPLTTLSRLSGCAEAEVQSLIDELDRNGVFSRDRKGRIYCRRMVRDAQRRATAKANGEKGGNPTLCPDKQKTVSVNPSDNPEVKPHIPEANNQNKDIASNDACPKPARRRISYPSDFEEKFWKVYPTDPNMSKKQALSAWNRLGPEERELACESLPAFVAHCRGSPDYRPVHAVRYLSERRFDGWIESARKLAAMTEIKPGTPQWNAWRAYKVRNGERVAWMDAQGRSGNGYPVPSEWPPGERAA